MTQAGEPHVRKWRGNPSSRESIACAGVPTQQVSRSVGFTLFVYSVCEPPTGPVRPVRMLNSCAYPGFYWSARMPKSIYQPLNPRLFSKERITLSRRGLGKPGKEKDLSRKLIKPEEPKGQNRIFFPSLIAFTNKEDAGRKTDSLPFPEPVLCLEH